MRCKHFCNIIISWHEQGTCCGCELHKSEDNHRRTEGLASRKKNLGLQPESWARLLNDPEEWRFEPHITVKCCASLAYWCRRHIPWLGQLDLVSLQPCAGYDGSTFNVQPVTRLVAIFMCFYPGTSVPRYIVSEFLSVRC